MKKAILTGSIRIYAVVFIEGESTNSHPCITLDDILNNEMDWEYYNAIRDDIDKVLDLKVGEKIGMKFNRDNADSDGIIKRLK